MRDFDTDENGMLSQDEINAVNTIKYWGSSGNMIAPLEGVPYFTNLTTLDYYYNQIAELDLGNNLDLYSLYCTYNCFTELDFSNNEILHNVDLTWQDRDVTALASDDKLVVSLEGLVSSEHIGNVTPVDPAVTLEDNYLIIPDLTVDQVDYNYTTQLGDMDVHGIYKKVKVKVL